MTIVLGQRIKSIRQRLNLTQDEVVERSDKAIGRRRLVDLERDGEHTVRPRVLRGLEKALRCSPAELTGEADVAPGPAQNTRDLSVRVTSACRLNYDLVARRYGVDEPWLVAMAPVLFAILAEQSLQWRVKRAERADEVLSSISGDLASLTSIRGRDQHAIRTSLQAERRAIEEGNVFTPGMAAPLVDDENDLVPTTAFDDFLTSCCTTADGVGLSGTSDVLSMHRTWGPTLTGDTYLASIAEMEHILGTDALGQISEGHASQETLHAVWALAQGNVRRSAIPPDVESAGPDAMIAFLASKYASHGVKLA